jgi:epoxyqueuosine reductase
VSQKVAARLKASLCAKAEALGFDACAIADVDGIPQAPGRLRQFLADGHHATMEWMAETQERRGSPCVLWPEARRIITLAMTYAGEGDPLAPA